MNIQTSQWSSNWECLTFTMQLKTNIPLERYLFVAGIEYQTSKWTQNKTLIDIRNEDHYQKFQTYCIKNSVLPQLVYQVNKM